MKNICTHVMLKCKHRSFKAECENKKECQYQYAVIADDAFHYESLISCCSKLLDEVDKGKTPRRQIMGLRILLNR